MTCAVLSAVICSSPFAFGSEENQSPFVQFICETPQTEKEVQHTVNAVGLTNVTREESFLEHIETSHAETFRPTE